MNMRTYRAFLLKAYLGIFLAVRAMGVISATICVCRLFDCFSLDWMFRLIFWVTTVWVMSVLHVRERERLC